MGCRRASSLLVGVSVALQLAASGFVATCRSPAADRIDAADMAGMDMSADQKAPRQSDAPCRSPCAPADCQIMTACTLVFDPAARVAAVGAGHATAERMTLVMIAPRTHALAPEPPPPKA